MTIFERRTAFKPFEYPHVVPFKKAIQHSFWTEDEWTFTSDKHEFHHELTEIERSLVKNSMLAISQIEVKVKEFWGNIGNRFPKPEIEQVGATFSENEVRHADAYSHLLEVLGLNGDYELLLQNPVIQGRVDYLTKYLKGASSNSNENYTLTLTLFSLFIENVSLFSQFAAIKSLNKHKNVLKDIDNVIQATAKEEDLHARFGIELIKIIKSEFPEWFNDEFYQKIYRASKKAYEAEAAIIDWMFEAGEPDFLSKENLKEFVKHRINESVKQIGGEDVYEVDQLKLESLRWFNEEIYAEVNTDFFHKKPVTYSKKSQAITAEDLF